MCLILGVIIKQSPSLQIMNYEKNLALYMCKYCMLVPMNSWLEFDLVAKQQYYNSQQSTDASQQFIVRTQKLQNNLQNTTETAQCVILWALLILIIMK